MSTNTHVAVFHMQAGHHYSSDMPSEEAFASASKENVDWALLIDLSNGKVVQMHGLAAAANVDINAAADVVSENGTPLVSAQTGTTEVSCNWDMLDAGYIALSMDSAGQIRGWTAMPDQQDTQGNYYSSIIRATDIGASYGIVLNPETMNTINPHLRLTPGTKPHSQSLVTRQAAMEAAAQEALGDNATIAEAPAGIPASDLPPPDLAG